MLSLITLAATVPMLATSVVQLQDTAQNTSDKEQAKQAEIKTEKCHMLVRATRRSTDDRKEALRDMMLFLRDGRIVLRSKQSSDLHPFTGYFLPYPDKPYEGMVTTINEENFLNWVFVDMETYQVKHGVRKDAQPQLTGPAKLISDDGEYRVSFSGFEGFVAVEVAPGDFELYFDKDDDRLKAKAPSGAKVTEIELMRTPLEEYRPVQNVENPLIENETPVLQELSAGSSA